MEYNSFEMAYCGLCCTACSFKVAFESGDRRHVGAMPARYDRMKALPFSELACEGCKGQNICGECDMKDCAAAKGLEHCAACDDFPCAHTNKFQNDGVPHHRQAVEDLHKIKAVGVEAWFAEYSKGLTCAACGKRQSWYCRCAQHNAE